MIKVNTMFKNKEKYLLNQFTNKPKEQLRVLYTKYFDL